MVSWALDGFVAMVSEVHDQKKIMLLYEHMGAMLHNIYM